jgi:hypothetical protein
MIFVFTVAAVAQSTADLPRQSSRVVPLTVPIGCLMTPGCFDNISGREAARKSDPVTLSEALISPGTPDRVTSSNPAIFGIDRIRAAEAADNFLSRVAVGIRREDLLATGPMPRGEHILTPITADLQARLRDYINGHDFFSCALVFVAMRRANAEIVDKVALAGVLWDLYGRYLDACNKGTLNELGDARGRMVVLVRKDIRDRYYAYCLGFNFAASYILTAHHCLVDPEDISIFLSRFKPSDPDAFIPRAGPLPRSGAILLGEPGKILPIRIPPKMVQDLDFYPFELNRDTVILELEGIDRSDVTVFPWAEPAEWDRIAVPGLFIEDKALSDAIESAQGDVLDRAISEASALDIAPLCTLVFSAKTSEPFVFHGCQTRYGYSGGPIFRREPGGTMTLIGIHAGSVDKANPVDGWPYATLFPNYGLRLPAIAREVTNTPDRK